MPGRRRTWLLRLLTAITIPAAALLLCEGILRLTGCGYSPHFLVPMEGQAFYTGNPRFGWRFFPRELSRSPTTIRLPATRAEDEYRIFILGGSAAMGVPEPAFSLGRILEVMLRERFPSARFRVVNAAMTAVNSHVVREIAADCARHDPSLFIVYMGNNEVVGPFGPGSVFTSDVPPMTAIRAGVLVRATRTGQLIRSMARGAGSSGAETGWRGMEMFADRKVALDDPALDVVIAHFRENLHAICRSARRAGAPVILSTVAVNLRDGGPFASIHRRDLPASALEEWNALAEDGTMALENRDVAGAARAFFAALAIDDHYADLAYRLAHSVWEANPGDAAAYYGRARDLDALRFRADSRVNAAIRSTAAELAVDGVALADAEHRTAESHGVPGRELFHEHVHMTFEGNWSVANVLMDAVVEHLPAAIRQRDAGQTPPADRCAVLLGLTPSDRFHMATLIWEMTARAPFTGRSDHHRQQEALYGKMRALRSALTPRTLGEGLQQVARAQAAAPNDDTLKARLAGRLYEAGRFDDAVRLWRDYLARLPGDPLARIRCGAALLGLQDAEPARREFDAAQDLAGGRAEYDSLIGEIYLRHGRPEDAIASFRAGLEKRPGNATLRNNLGMAFMNLQHYHDAERELAVAVEAVPENAVFRDNLGSAQLLHGKLADARQHLEEALRVDPFLVPAYDHLAMTLARQGDVEQAVMWLEKGLALDPENPGLLRHHREVKAFLAERGVP